MESKTLDSGPLYSTLTIPLSSPVAQHIPYHHALQAGVGQLQENGPENQGALTASESESMILHRIMPNHAAAFFAFTWKSAEIPGNNMILSNHDMQKDLQGSPNNMKQL